MFGGSIRGAWPRRDRSCEMEAVRTDGLVRYHDIPKPRARPPGPGVKAAGVKTPVERLKPKTVFVTGGCPDWLAPAEAQGAVWVSDNPNSRVLRLDAETSRVAATVTVG